MQMQVLPFHDFIFCLKLVSVSESLISSGNEAINDDLCAEYFEFHTFLSVHSAIANEFYFSNYIGHLFQ